MELFLLFVAWLLTGVNLILSKAVIELGLSSYVYLYMVGFWCVGIVIGLVVRAVTRHPSTRLDALVGASMGFAGAVAMLTFMLALAELPGVVVFPVRSCGNVLLTAFLSHLIWREKLRPRQWLGILTAALAIYLLL
ncbi:MAG: EamA family transporter [Armatimonadota bacterium]